MRRFIVLTGILAAFAGYLAVHRLSWPGPPDGRETLALLAALLIVLLTPLNFRRLSRVASPTGDAARPYFVLVSLLYGAAAVGSVFGTAREVEIRFVLHLLAAELVNRVLLLFPQRLFGLLRDWRRTRTYFPAELLLVNLVLLLVMSEAVLRVLPRLDTRFQFLVPMAGYESRKIRLAMFGEEPNRHGFNDREVTRTKSPGVFRIAAIGDSFIVGFVPRRFGFVPRLEEELKGDGSRIEVVNFGVVGSEPSDYLRILDQEVLAFQPDLILLGLYVGNDIKERRSPLSPLYKEWYRTFQAARWIFARDRIASEFVDLTRIKDQSEELWLHSQRIPEVWSRTEFLRRSAKREDLLRSDGGPAVQRAWRATFSVLAGFQAACVGASVPVGLVIFPDQVQIDPQLRQELARSRAWDLSKIIPDLPQRHLREFLSKRGFPWLDLLGEEIFRSGTDVAELFLPNDSHLSPQGNHLAARATARWLVQSGLLEHP